MKQILSKYTLEHEVYVTVLKKIEEQMNLGLKPDTNAKADLKMFPTYVRSLPNGTGNKYFPSTFSVREIVHELFCMFLERGSFLALDLGGTNFRVLLIDLVDSEHVQMKNKIYPIAQATMKGPGEKVDY